MVVEEGDDLLAEDDIPGDGKAALASEFLVVRIDLN
jgi:hypothetical protein